MSLKGWFSEYRRPEFWSFLGIFCAAFVGIPLWLHRADYAANEVFGRVVISSLMVALFYPLYARFRRKLF